MRYVEMIKNSLIVAGNLNAREIYEYKQEGYRMIWQEQLKPKNKIGIRVAS